MELGYTPTEIRRLLAVYDDHFLAPWKASDLTLREAPPACDIERCQVILGGTIGYDWMIMKNECNKGWVLVERMIQAYPGKVHEILGKTDENLGKTDEKIRRQKGEDSVHLL